MSQSFSEENASGVTSTQVQQGAFNYAQDSGIVNAYEVALTPAVVNYATGVYVDMRATSTNTSASTLDAGGGALPIQNQDGSAIAANAILNGGQYRLTVNPALTAWILSNSSFDNSLVLPLSPAQGGTGITVASYLQPGGRLTLQSAAPVPNSDILAATTLYYTPYKGNVLPLYDGTKWGLFPFTQLSIAIPATTSQMYDVFIYNNAGTPTLELSAWATDTTRVAGLVYQDGYITKIPTTRLYLGSIRTTTVSGQCEDSFKKRYVWNNYHRVRKFMRVVDTTDSWTHSTTAYRQANANADNQLDFIIGAQEDAVEASLIGCVTSSTVNSRAAGVSIGFNSTTTKADNAINGICVLNDIMFMQPVANYTDYAQLGRTTLVWLEVGGGADTQTWFGDNGSSGIQTGIRGSLFC